MTSVTPADKLSELFQTFRDNENELDQLKQSARQKTQAVERAQYELRVVQDRVAVMESEHRDLRKVLVKTKEHNNVIEAQLSKEKEGQYATYIELVKLEEQKKHLEELQLEQQLAFAKQLRSQSTEHANQRRADAEALRQDIKRIVQSTAAADANQ